MCEVVAAMVFTCSVHLTETPIRDIERHFALVPDDKITTRPHQWWLSLHFTLSGLPSL